MAQKPKPGVCGRCGHAVMRSPKAPPQAGELNGHLYREGKLVRVRCVDHQGENFEAYPGGPSVGNYEW